MSLSDPYPATWLTSEISKDLFIPKINKIKWCPPTQNMIQIRIAHLKYDQEIPWPENIDTLDRLFGSEGAQYTIIIMVISIFSERQKKHCIDSFIS